MKYSRLGKTNLKVSEVGFGGIPIIPLPFEMGVSVVRHAYSRGVTFFDTANIYGDSERMMGQALEQVREKVVLATKSLKRDGDSISRHITYSLQNLRTSFIDIYQFHGIANEETLNELFARGGAYEAVEKARSEGKIRFIGFSSHDIKTAIKACQTGLFSSIQFPFNFIETDAAEELFVTARELDMGIIGMKPLGGGLLERADLCFGFLQQYPYVVPIPGISSSDEIDEIIGLYESPKMLTEENWKEIEAIRSDLGKTFCHRCGYCMPCKQGVEILDGMQLKSMMKRLDLSRLIHMERAAMDSVENCIECGECIERCPYNLPIPDVLRDNLAFYKDLCGQNDK